MAESIGQFGIVDYVVLCCMLFVSVAIGISQACVGGKQKTKEEFLLGNRSMNPIAVAMSLTATMISSLTVLGFSSESYFYGIVIWLGAPTILFAGLFTAFFVMPVLFRLKIISAYEYLELRFNKAVRICGLVSFIIWMILYMGIVIYGPSLALNIVTGISLWGSIVVTGVACTLYTTIGGIKAVIWTDVFQLTTIFVGMLCALIEGLRRIGSFEKILQTGMENDRIVFDFSADPSLRHSVWTVFVGGIFGWCSIFVANQGMVQRYLSVKSVKKARISLIFGSIGIAVLYSIAIMTGLTVFTYYAGCDPLRDGKITSPDQIIIFFIMDVFAELPGIPGLFVAAMFGATLSTVSSALNALAAVTTQDIVVPFFKGIEEGRLTTLTKAFALVYGVIAVFASYAVSLAGYGLLIFAFNIFGLLGGPLFGIFCLGIFFPWSNSKGALCGFLVGVGLIFWIIIGTLQYPRLTNSPPLSIDDCVTNAPNVSTVEMVTIGLGITGISTSTPVPEPRPAIATLYSVSYDYYSLIACCTTIIVGLLVSLITGPTKPCDLDPKLFMSVTDAMYCCCPESCKRAFRCGVRRYQSKDEMNSTSHDVEISVISGNENTE